MSRGKFVVISGSDGAGKTTLIKEIKKLYPKLISVREPGGTEVSEAIRNELLSEGAKDWHPMSQLLHFFAARANLLEKVVKPALESGEDVIADRFDESTYAYQVFAFESMELKEVFWSIRRQLIVARKLEPDVYIYIKVPVEVGMKRRALAGKGTMNHLDERSKGFYERVGEGLDEFFFVVNHKVIDGNQSQEAVLSDVLKILIPILGEPKYEPDQ